MNWLNRLLANWLNKRIPAASDHQLNHKNIFILPSRFGAWFLLLCGLLFLLGTNYQNNLMLLLCYFLLALFLVSLLASYQNFSKLIVQQGKCPTIFVGDSLHMPLWIKHQPQQPPASGQLFLNFSRLGSNGAKLQDINSIKNRAENRAENSAKNPPATLVDLNTMPNPISISLPCDKRGKLDLPRVTITSYFPLGLFKCWTHLAFNADIVVYPKPFPCNVALASRENDDNAPQESSATWQTGYDDFSHLQAYQVGEPLYHVAWKQVAKGRGMVSKQFSSASQRTVWLHLPSAINSPAVTAEIREQALSKLCFQVLELGRGNNLFGLDLGHIKITPSQGFEHIERCLKALALYPSVNPAEPD